MEKDILENKQIAIIGYGNMGRAIVQGLLNRKTVKRSQLHISNSSGKNATAVMKSQIIILCVKPQIMSRVIADITVITDIIIMNKLFISVAAGISLDSIQNKLDTKAKMIRVMPNLCARVGESMSCWVKNKRVTLHDTNIVIAILESFGRQLEMVNENDLNKATAISGSGPAYIFYFIEAFIEASRSLGLGDDASKLLVTQTLKGSLLTLFQSHESVAELRKQVTSKGGTTEAAINIFEKKGFKQILFEAVQSAYNRSLALQNYKL